MSRPILHVRAMLSAAQVQGLQPSSWIVRPDAWDVIIQTTPGRADATWTERPARRLLGLAVRLDPDAPVDYALVITAPPFVPPAPLPLP